MRFLARYALWLVLLAPLAASAQVARVEISALPSSTLTDQQFLTGVRRGKPVTLAGELRSPKEKRGLNPIDTY